MNTEDTPWITASDTGTSCVKMHRHDGRIELGDTKDPEGPVLGFSQTEFGVFLAGVESGVFDRFRSS